MNMIYLYLHQIMLRYSHNYLISRKDAVYIISRHLKFTNNINRHLLKDIRKVIERSMLNDMCKLKLLERFNRKRGFNKKGFKIINLEKSSNIDKGVLADLLTVGKE